MDHEAADASADPVALRTALDVALDSLGRAAVVIANNHHVRRDDVSMARIAREVFDAWRQAEAVRPAS